MRGTCAAIILVGVLAGAARADVVTEPYPGVTYVYRETAVPQRIFAVLVDLDEPGVRVRATRAAEKGQPVSAFAAETGCEVAVNGDFFDASLAPIGLAFGDGERWPGASDTALEGFVAVGDGRAAITAPATVVDPPEAWMREVVSGRPILVEDGALSPAVDCTTSFCGRHPRTAVGLDASGRTLILAVVDGRSPDSAGMTMREIGELMLDLGAHTALNLDGGGSSDLVIGGLVMNEPSDGRERTVANHLGIDVTAPFGQVVGYVRDGDLYDVSRSIPGARVTVLGREALTDAGGRFRIGGVPAGEVTVSVSAPGYADSARSITVAPGQTTWASVALVPGEAASESGGCSAARGRGGGDTLLLLGAAHVIGVTCAYFARRRCRMADKQWDKCAHCGARIIDRSTIVERDNQVFCCRNCEAMESEKSTGTPL